MRSTLPTFDDSLIRAVQAVQQLLPGIDSARLIFVRDILGRLFVVLPDDISDPQLSSLQGKLQEALGAYAPYPKAALHFGDTLDGDALRREPTLLTWVDDFAARVIDRRALGQDWIRQPQRQASNHTTPRFVFYSLKGGVGRSTALALWAQHHVAQGGTVLVVDLDLEAPGLGSQLLTRDQLPAYGVVDWLVQDLVDGDTRPIIERQCAESTIADTALLVVPAFGASTDQHPDNLMAKLARAYLEKDQANGTEHFAQRLERMLQALEAHYQPDLILLDSRAGLHETAAAALLHLNAEVLCFAVDLPVTWQGYRYLFGHLRQLAQSAAGSLQDPELTLAWRERFKMVNARAESQAEQAAISNAYALWADTLYDPVLDNSDETSFSYDLNDSAAPHYPLMIPRSERFERCNLLNALDRIGQAALQADFGDFFAGLDERLDQLHDDH